MATISSTGLGSGLDVQSIVSQLVTLERRPITQLQTAAKGIQTQVSAYGTISSLVDTLAEKASALAASSLWSKTTATPSDASALQTVSTGATPPGSYTVGVTQLARAQSLASAPLAGGSAAVVGAGQLQLAVGGASPLSLSFSDPNTTLAQVRDAINASAAGVSAAIVQDASGTRLTLSSRSPGAANTLAVTATALDGSPLAGGLAAFSVPGGMTQTQAGANALLSVNGLALESPSNQVEGAIEGLTLKLQKAGGGPMGVQVDADSSAQTAAVQAFAEAYNALNTALRAQTRYDESTQTAGALQGDSTAVGVMNQMRNLLRASNSASPGLSTLSALGLQVQKDGSLKVDDDTLKAALTKPAEVQALLASPASGGAAATGLALRFSELGTRLTGYEGLLSSRQEALQARLDRNGDEQDRLEARIARTQARLLAQYQALDTRVSQLNGLQSYVTQQLAAFNNNSSS